MLMGLWSHDLTMNVDKKGILPKKACGGHLEREILKRS
jgi:hypothetical protein